MNEIRLKGPRRQKQTQEQNKKDWASSTGLCQRHKPQHPHHVKVSLRRLTKRQWRTTGLTIHKQLYNKAKHHVTKLVQKLSLFFTAQRLQQQLRAKNSTPTNLPPEQNVSFYQPFFLSLTCPIFSLIFLGGTK